jgi:hypothetical protein
METFQVKEDMLPKTGGVKSEQNTNVYILPKKNKTKTIFLL